ncbi:MAG: ATP-dependent Clp protease ATP-binding subunit ClpA [Candidatus Hydrogenedentes bacterium]|nr:ATP-dependent Clp protease ATP-binding subunit ClpA [Candidatus Hydrogenedentota bacterium]
MISKQLEMTLGMAFTEAHERRHEYLCVEHLLYALLEDDFGRDIIVNCGGDTELLRQSLEQFFENDVNRVPGDVEYVPTQTVAFERVMQRALSHVHYSGKKEVDAGDVLAAMFEERESHSAFFLRTQGINRLDVLNFLSHGISKYDQGAEEDDELDDEAFDEEDGAPERRRTRDPLEAFTENLTERARAGKIDPLIGREPELRRTLQILCRRLKNNPVYVGEPGVGKTAIVEGLALRVVEGKVPDMLKDVTILRLDMAALLAGTRFRGDFEQRMKAVIEALVTKDDIVLFIDEIHTVVGAGATTDSTMDASNMLKPVLARGDVRCIGATTYEEYKNHFERDRALSRRFQKVEISEPTVEETVLILRGLKQHYEKHHKVTYTDTALRAAAELSAKHINDRFLPDKAIDVIDEAGARIKLMPKGRRKSIRPADIEQVVAEIAKIPARSVSSSDKTRLGNLADQLKRVVFGQDEAIQAMATAIKRARAGLGNTDKPVGSFLFTGPTGVGKTEVAKQLSYILGVHFARYDMSEYMEKHAVARLIGSPPGYVGFEQGGMLVDEIRKHPHCVLLLDEIEKAHEDLFSILLQVMDRATLTDNSGRKADFRNAILIMTSNAGARDLTARSIGFGSIEGSNKGKSLKAVEKMFSPEFRNRLDGIITFNNLDPEIISRIVDKFIAELQLRLMGNKVALTMTPEARAWLAKKGYDPSYGARPLGRVIQTEIKDQIADEILFGKLVKGGKVEVGLDDDRLTFAYT